MNLRAWVCTREGRGRLRRSKVVHRKSRSSVRFKVSSIKSERSVEGSMCSTRMAELDLTRVTRMIYSKVTFLTS